jgi:hypothetical protein
MADTDHNQRPGSGPFGMGRQGYLVVAIVVLATALFAATRRDWTSMLISALLFPLIVFALVHLVTRFRQAGMRPWERRGTPGEGMDPLTFLARTNPFMFLLLGAVSRGVEDERYQELLRSGPFGLGQYGYFVALLIILAPLALALIITAATGQIPMHTAPHF